MSNKHSAKATPKFQPPHNPLVGDTAAETLGRARNLAQFLTFTVESLARDGSNEQSTDGLSLVMEMLTDGLDAALTQAAAEVRHG